MSKHDPIAHKRALMTRIRTEGVDAAFEALMSVCRDPKAPAPAKATSGTTLFRVAGYMSDKPDAADKSPEDMTAAEITSRIDYLRSQYESAIEGLPDGDGDDEDNDGKPNDLFG